MRVYLPPAQVRTNDTWPASAGPKQALILGVNSLSKQRHFGHTEKSRFLELLNINTA